VSAADVRGPSLTGGIVRGAISKEQANYIVPYVKKDFGTFFFLPFSLDYI